MCTRDQLIRGLIAYGYVEDQNPGRTKYRVFEGPFGTMFVGKAGGLRVSREGLVTASRSLTDSAIHRAFVALGNPQYRFESREQAVSAFNLILHELRGK